MSSVDVAVLGGGLAGLGAAHRLRGHGRVRVFEAAESVGGRTRSVRTGAHTWANLGAQYVSADKALVFELAEALDVPLVPADESWGSTLDRLADLRAADPSGVDEVGDRLRAEQSRPRDPAAAELDDTTFGAWLGEVSDPVRAYLGQWCRIVLNADVDMVSLYGVLLAWGDQRVSPWLIDRDAGEGRRSSLVLGGTGRLAEALAAASEAEVVTGTQVCGVVAKGDGFEIELRGPSGTRSCRARAVVCALPAPVAVRVLADLPAEKAEALAAVRYGRYLTTPVLLSADPDSPAGPAGPGSGSTFSAVSSSGFTFPTPTDFAVDGGTVHSFVAEPDLEELWSLDDASVAVRASAGFVAEFPELERRVREVRVQRWAHGLPRFAPGRVKLQSVLEAPVGGVHFAGDYMAAANMNGALESGRRAANQILEESGLLHRNTTDQRRVTA